jgi:chemotaxis protein methyltransferase CheR
MIDSEFEFLCGFLKAQSGLSLGADKRYLVDSRLGAICRRYKLASLSEMVAKLRGQPRNPELEKAVIEAMTTNETFFFRDKTPFDLFSTVLLPQMMAARAATKKIRIWCAASSTGQEPYSLAMIANDMGARLAGWKVEIVATDIAEDVLEKAKAGIYSQFEVQRGLPINFLLKYFKQNGDIWQIAPNIRAMVDFKPLNLIKDFSHMGTFDIIYCRNVLIYFTPETKGNVMKRLSQCLSPDGALLLGAAESVIGLTDALIPSPDHRGLFLRNTSAAKAAPALKLAAG